ncbi:MAG: hypothetical protein WC803_07670 [Sphingomonas sp.]|jgi:hypothetical protein
MNFNKIRIKELRRTFALFVALVVFSTAACSNPFKITDPSDPKFDPDHFSFDDYRGINKLAEAYAKLFPIGTPKSFVDRVLINAGESISEQDKTFPEVWHYWHKKTLRNFDGPPQDVFIFDEKDTLVNIHPLGGPAVYDHQLNLDQLNKNRLKNEVKK